MPLLRRNATSTPASTATTNTSSPNSGRGYAVASELRMLKSMPKSLTAGMRRPFAPPVKVPLLKRNASSATAAARVSTARWMPRVAKSRETHDECERGCGQTCEQQREREGHAQVATQDPEHEPTEAGERHLRE